VVHQGELVRATCTYINNTGHTVSFGDSSTAEQCFVGMYRRPAILSSRPFDCTN